MCVCVCVCVCIVYHHSAPRRERREPERAPLCACVWFGVRPNRISS